MEANLAKLSIMSQEPKSSKQLLLPKGVENSSACLHSPWLNEYPSSLNKAHHVIREHFPEANSQRTLIRYDSYLFPVGSLMLLYI